MTNPISPRTGATKTSETAVDLTILALATTLGFAILRQRYAIDPQIETSGTALIMALGGTIARAARHWFVYLRRR